MKIVDDTISACMPVGSCWLCIYRAEATDVANAVLDGVDGVMLGAETLRGKYPAITVKTVLAICRQAEEVFDYSGHFEWLTLQGELVSPVLVLFQHNHLNVFIRSAGRCTASTVPAAGRKSSHKFHDASNLTVLLLLLRCALAGLVASLQSCLPMTVHGFA